MGAKPHNQQLGINLTLLSLFGLREPACFGDGETLRDGGKSFPLVCFSGVGLLLGGELLRGLALRLAGEALLK
jgi:hypothetical protein